ncbi:MAG: molybdenum cofactor guanylyltransferase [Brotaphodocola sp.]
MKADALILAGGKSRRMGGNHKGNLMFQGQTFQERIISELKKEAQTIWVSYGKDVKSKNTDCRVVHDIYPDCGPIGGIHAGLSACTNALVMVASCDLPFLKIELYRWLCDRLLEAESEQGIQYEGVVPVVNGRIHPLSAVYRKSAAKMAERQILTGNYRMCDLAEDSRIFKVQIPVNMVRMLTNVNTLEEYEKFNRELLKKGT